MPVFENFSLFNPSSEHEMLRNTLREFVKKEVEPQALEYDRREEFNINLFKKLSNLGLLGLTVEEKYGMGMDASALCIVHEELSFSDPGLCLAYLAHSVLCTHNVDQNASSEQKDKWLPKLCSGEWIGAMGMSEPDAGTDVLSLKTQVKKEGDLYIMNGRKMWITNGVLNNEKELVDACLVYAKTDSSSENSKNNMCLFFVQKGTKGFSAGQNIKSKTGMRASNTAELVFQDCEIPVFNLVGQEGKALHAMMKNLEIERLALASMSLGIARRAFEEMNKYSSERTAFKKPIRNFGQIQKYLAQSYSELQSVRCYVYSIAKNLDFKKNRLRLESDSAKLLASQMAKKVADRAIQVLGGYGYVGEFHVERLWRDSKLLEIGGGTIEALEKNISKEVEPGI